VSVVVLREARADDRERIRAWRNDPETRGRSFQPDEVSAEDHARWFERRMDDPGCLLLIAESEGAPVGVLRFEREGDGLEVHLTIAPEHRGKGYAAELLRLGTERVTENVLARVKPDNERSLHAFKRAGFTEIRRSPEVVELRSG
jgi:UDP-2,4-diacetamido-2,4,6-trideoxy-beta-L-altropyranose hydrolase